MFRLATVPARRVRPLAARTVPGLPTPFSPPPAAAAAVVSRRTAAKKQKPYTHDIVLIERSLDSFKALHKELGLTHTSPERAYAVYQKALKALTTRRNDPYWDQYFVYDLGRPSAVDVHDTAVFLHTFKDNHPGETHLTHHLLNIAAGMGSDASALSNAKYLLEMKDQKYGYFSYNGPAWAKTRERVASLIKQGRDANAIVIEGLIHMLRETPKDDLLALDAFGRAWKLGQSTAHFDWEATCLEKQGDVQLRLGRKEDATRSFRKLMMLRYNRGFYRYAMMKPDDPMYATYLTHAACSGMIDPMEPLINELMRLSAKSLAEGNKKVADAHRLHALEWSRLLEEFKAQFRRPPKAS